MKEIKWMGSSYKDLLSFPKEAKQVAGFNLDRVQRGWEPCDWKPISSIGQGVKEIRIHTSNQYRVFYVTNIDDVIYVLHAFAKKTRKTKQADIDIGKTRYRQIKRGE